MGDLSPMPKHIQQLRSSGQLDHSNFNVIYQLIKLPLKLMKKALFFLIGILSLNTSFSQSVSIISSAVGNAKCVGSSVTFTASTSGLSSPTYQWYKNSVAISGETSASYTTTTLSNNDQISVFCGIVKDNTLSLWLDAGNSSSYSGTGTTLTYVPANNGAYTLTAGDRIQFDYFY